MSGETASTIGAGRVRAMKDYTGAMAKDKRSKAIRKTIRKAQDSTSAANRSTQIAERLALAAKSSEMLSSVWTLPPAQLLRFHLSLIHI